MGPRLAGGIGLNLKSPASRIPGKIAEFQKAYAYPTDGEMQHLKFG